MANKLYILSDYSLCCFMYDIYRLSKFLSSPGMSYYAQWNGVWWWRYFVLYLFESFSILMFVSFLFCLIQLNCWLVVLLPISKMINIYVSLCLCGVSFHYVMYLVLLLCNVLLPICATYSHYVMYFSWVCLWNIQSYAFCLLYVILALHTFSN